MGEPLKGPLRLATVQWRAPAQSSPPSLPSSVPAQADSPTSVQDMIKRRLLAECVAMLTYSATWGKAIPAELALLFDADPATRTLSSVISMHNQLAILVSPALPNTILLMEEERRRHPLMHVFGAVRLVRYLLIFAALCLAAVCSLATSSLIDAKTVSRSWFVLHGTPAALVTLFLLATASLGAAFANLSIVNRFIVRGNYDQKYESTYWIRVMLGMMSGVVLCEILFDSFYSEPKAKRDPELAALARIGLAFLGGYSAAQVQALLDNLSASLGTLFRGGNTLPPRPAPPPSPPQAPAQAQP